MLFAIWIKGYCTYTVGIREGFKTKTGTNIIDDYGVWGRVVLDKDLNILYGDNGEEIKLKDGYYLIDYQPKFSTRTEGYSVAKVSIKSDKHDEGQVITGAFVYGEEYRKLREKIGRDKIREYFDLAKQFYDVAREKDEEIVRKCKEWIDDICKHITDPEDQGEDEIEHGL